MGKFPNRIVASPQCLFLHVPGMVEHQALSSPAWKGKRPSFGQRIAGQVWIQETRTTSR